MQGVDTLLVFMVNAVASDSIVYQVTMPPFQIQNVTLQLLLHKHLFNGS